MRVSRSPGVRWPRHSHQCREARQFIWLYDPFAPAHARVSARDSWKSAPDPWARLHHRRGGANDADIALPVEKSYPVINGGGLGLLSGLLRRLGLCRVLLVDVRCLVVSYIGHWSDTSFGVPFRVMFRLIGAPVNGRSSFLFRADPSSESPTAVQ